MKFSSFLPSASPSLKQKLERLTHSKIETPAIERANLPIWRADFFKVEQSSYWAGLADEKKEIFLKSCSRDLLIEAILIEHAGIAYANKMALLAKTQEERSYYTIVAQEELQHLHWLQPFCELNAQDVSSEFAKLTATVIENENRLSSIIVIQLLLEGWGISYYQSLQTGTDHGPIKKIISGILTDETKHHGGGIILLQDEFDKLTLPAGVQDVIDMVRLGPFKVAKKLAELTGVSNQLQMQELLISIEALQSTTQKLGTIYRVLKKVFSAKELAKLNLSPLALSEMSQLILNSLKNSQPDCRTTDTAL